MPTMINYTIHNRPRMINGEMTKETVTVTVSLSEVKLLAVAVGLIESGRAATPLDMPEFGITINNISEE